MKERNKRAFGLAAIWSFLASGIFTMLSSRPTGLDLITLLLGICCFTPVQFITGFLFSRLMTWFNYPNRKPIFARARQILSLLISRFVKERKCLGCGKEIAAWECYYHEKENRLVNPEFFCDNCMIVGVKTLQFVKIKRMHVKVK
jgi:hypothetical protein